MRNQMKLVNVGCTRHFLRNVEEMKKNFFSLHAQLFSKYNIQRFLSRTSLSFSLRLIRETSVNIIERKLYVCSLEKIAAKFGNLGGRSRL